MRILSNRLLSASRPMKLCLTSSSSMSSSDVSTKKPEKKRESLRSVFAQFFGGKIDPAYPEDGPLDSKDVNLPDVTEQATGEYKLFLLAFENGIIDPFCNLPTERNGAGTKDNPVKVESFINERLVACVCETSQSFVKYTHVYKNEPKRCQCGHWLKLVDAPKFWQKIPVEDLLTIPYFRELQEEGKLEKALSGELDEELYGEHHGDKHH